MKFTSILIAALLNTAVHAADQQTTKQNLRRAAEVTDKPQPRPPRQPRKHPQTRGERPTKTVKYFTMGANNDDQSSTNNDESDKDIRIVGGSESSPGEFPYYVDLGGCGGSLIAPDVVLTAAHCGSYQNQEVIVGAYRYGSTANNAVRVSVTSEAPHPNYNDDTVANDFQLLRLSKEVTIGGSNVYLSVNGLSTSPSNGESLTVLGLGATSEGGSGADTLRDVQVNAISESTCNSQDKYGGQVDYSNMFCAGVNGGGKDSCQGDSGGPIVKRVGNQHIQVGVVSWGYGCARPESPGVYARVSSAYGWIEQVVCDQWNANASFCSGGGSQPSPTPPTPSPPSPTPPSPTPPSPSPPTSGSCIPMSLKLKTDDYGFDTDLFLLTDSGNLIWNANGFADNADYQFSTCLDVNECATLDVFDHWGDGIMSPGGIKLDVNGQTYFDSGDIGGGIVFRIGNSC